MILEKIKSALGLGPKKPTVELLISIEKIERRVALLEDGRLEEFQIERAGDVSLAGSIYKGRIKNLESGLKAMFVDIGYEKNAFLHYWDAMPAALDEIETIDRGAGKRPRRIQVEDIPELYPPGSEVVVQVTKGPIGNKGPRITTNISLPGRFVVLTPYSDQFGISRKISDPQERARLRKILSKLEVPEGIGVIIRTVGEGQRARFFVRDVAMLLDQWRRIEEGIKTKNAPAPLHEESDLVERSVRDFLTEDVDRIILDNEAEFDRIKESVASISRRSLRKIKLYQEPVPLFEKFGIDRQLDSAMRRQVYLKSGAYIVIDETEALVAIDVNTGRSKATADNEDTIVATNLEAAQEIARQLRLRNIGGLIIVDFIDMRMRKDQQAVYQQFRQALARDKAKTHVLPISPLGLIEMTRQRTEESHFKLSYEDCPYCRGRGRVRTPETMSLDIQREISRRMRLNPEVHEVRAIVHPKVLERLRTHDEESLIELERRFAGRLAFRADASFTQEQYRITNALNDQDLK